MFYEYLVLYIISSYITVITPPPIMIWLLKHLLYLVLFFIYYKNSIITFTGWEEERDENVVYEIANPG